MSEKQVQSPEQSNTLRNTEETHKGHLITRKRVEGTPFIKVEDATGEKPIWLIVIGRHGLSPLFETEQELDSWIATNHWNLVFNMVISMMEYNNELIGAKAELANMEIPDHPEYNNEPRKTAE